MTEIKTNSGDETNAIWQMKKTIADISRGDQPTTVLGILLSKGPEKPVTPELLAGLLGKELIEIDMTLEALAVESLVNTFEEHGIAKTIAFSSYDPETTL